MLKIKTTTKKNHFNNFITAFDLLNNTQLKDLNYNLLNNNYLTIITKHCFLKLRKYLLNRGNKLYKHPMLSKLIDAIFGAHAIIVKEHPV